MTEPLTSDSFQHMLATHPANHHPFFAFLEEKAETGLSAREYQAFAVNFIARTLFTIPEVASAVQRATMDLRPLGTGCGALTLLEEGGGFDPQKNHAILMVNAINHHGIAVYGDTYKAVDPKQIMDLFKLIHQSGDAISLKASAKRGTLKGRGLVASQYEELQGGIAIRKDRASWGKDHMKNALGPKSGKFPEDFHILMGGNMELFKLGVCPEVIAYGLEQMDVMDSRSDGKIAGTAFAHEGLADNMMFHVFQILYRDADKYPGGEAEFDAHVYPYFKAHGDYKAMAAGEIAVNEGEGVEAEHARREAAKIEEIIQSGSAAAQNAFKGAQEFADRQSNVWDGMLAAMSPSVRHHSLA